MRLFIVAALFTLFSSQALPQGNLSYTGRPRYPDGLLALRAAGGFTKYVGEFVDNSVSQYMTFSGAYALVPEFSIGLDANVGNTTYNRRVRRTAGEAYHIQFGDINQVDRNTTFSSFNLLFYLNFFPRQYFNTYLVTGAGVTFYQPADYEGNDVHFRPTNDFLASATIPIGLGIEFFLSRSLSIGAEFRNQFLFTDYFDSFASAEVIAQYRKETNEVVPTAALSEGLDSYFLLSIGAKMYLFENNDIDGDLLLNSEEEALNTNPYDIDTDGDGISDYEEVRVLHSDPLLKDTDGDGLNDYVEAYKYHTNPVTADTDGDGLTDTDEIATYKTNPLDADTDGDGLTDKEEVVIGTNPRSIDTDNDNLSDYAEAKIHATNPLVPDSDGDGLSDYEEVMTYLTDPKKADTDSDGLTDFDEVATYKTSPVRADTDGDGLTDGTEINSTGTSPQKKDTDDDGISDSLDRCPLIAETYNGVDDTDGCPDIDIVSKKSYAQAQVVTRPDYKPIRRTDTLIQVDTVYIREGGLLTLFGVNFEVDKDIIRPESFIILEQNLRMFKDYPEMIVEIRGHTDADASEEYNLDLSLRRAQAVKNFFTKHGLDPGRFSVRGFGESSPVASNLTEIGKARNRRIEFFIVKRGDRAPAVGHSMSSDEMLPEEK